MTGGAGAVVSGEAEIVSLLAPLTARFPGAFALADDCAVFAPEPGMEIVLNTDAVAAGVHFLPDDDPADVGWKALACNVSDLVAKGARPRVYLMSLAFPAPPLRAWLDAFVRGLGAAQERFGIVLAGGDTDRRPGPLSVTIAALGEVAAGRMVRRGAARPGDRLYVTGTLGDAALGLALRQDAARAAAWGLDAPQSAALLSRYLRPMPRPEMAAVLRDHARAAMDLSDGLAKDLRRMASASGCGAEIALPSLPRSAAVAQVATRDPSAAHAAMIGGGDDYEVLAAVADGAALRFEAAAATAGVRVTPIGTMTARADVVMRDADNAEMPIPAVGWDHF